MEYQSRWYKICFLREGWVTIIVLVLRKWIKQWNSMYSVLASHALIPQPWPVTLGHANGWHSAANDRARNGEFSTFNAVCTVVMVYTGFVSNPDQFCLSDFVKLQFDVLCRPIVLLVNNQACIVTQFVLPKRKYSKLSVWTMVWYEWIQWRSEISIFESLHPSTSLETPNL